MTRRARRALANLGLPTDQPLTVDTLLAAAGRFLGQTLCLSEALPKGVEIDINQVCGLTWIGEHGERRIWVSPRSVGEHRLFNAAHEVGHLLLGHEPVPMASLVKEPDFLFLSEEFRNGLLAHAREPGASRGSRSRKAEDEADAFGKNLLLTRDRTSAATGGDPMIDRFRRSL